MKNTKEQNAGNSTTKPSLQSQNLGPNKAATAVTPPITTPEAKPGVKSDAKSETKPEATAVIPEVAPKAADKPVTSKPMIEKAS